MIIVKFISGLGNQMFQYAFALKFIKTGKLVKGDFSFYRQFHCHQGYELNRVFNINLQEAGIRDLLYFTDREITEDGKSIFKLKKDRHYINECDSHIEFQFKPYLLSIDNAYCEGYWQNYRYFEDIRPELLKEFEFIRMHEIEKKNIEISEVIKKVNSISIHIRRGDYLESDIHLKMPLSYYRKSIELIKEKVTDPKFFIFSDDIEWTKNNFNLEDAYYISWNKDSYSYRDMHLMSICKHNIIANSTFSWWAAWLNTYSEKIIISPTSWFTDYSVFPGLLVKGWITQDVIKGME